VAIALYQDFCDVFPIRGAGRNRLFNAFEKGVTGFALAKPERSKG